jgi:hypothetical protein
LIFIGLSQVVYVSRKKKEMIMGNNGSDDSKDLLYLVGGLSLLIAGVGLIMAHPEVRRQVRASLDRVIPGIPGNLASGLSTVVPDIQRYMKLRAM